MRVQKYKIMENHTMGKLIFLKKALKHCSRAFLTHN